MEDGEKIEERQIQRQTERQAETDTERNKDRDTEIQGDRDRERTQRLQHCLGPLTG